MEPVAGQEFDSADARATLYDFGKSKMDLFKEWARLTLVEGDERDETVYGHALPMRTALSTLKTAIRMPLITHSRSNRSLSKKRLVEQFASTGASKNTVSTISKVSEVVGGGIIAASNPKEESFLERVQSGQFRSNLQSPMAPLVTQRKKEL